MNLERLKAYRKHLGDRLLIGTSTGSLHVVEVQHDDGPEQEAKIVSSKSLSRKPIDQLGYIKDINSVVALSGEY